MNIDLHILVSIVQLALIGIGGLYFVWTVKGRLDLLIQETGLRHNSNIEKFAEIYKKINELSETTAHFVKQEIRMDNVDERLQELSNRLSATSCQNFRPKKITPAKK